MSVNSDRPLLSKHPVNLSVSIDGTYHSVKEDLDDFVDNNHDQILVAKFKWLDKWMIYLLCVRAKTGILRKCIKRKRKFTKHTLTYFLPMIPLLICIGFLMYFAFAILNIVQTTDDFNSLVMSVMLCGYLGLIASRLILFCYYGNYDYPWHSQSVIELDKTKHSGITMRYYPLFLRLALVILFIFDIMDLITPQHAQY